MIYYVAYYIFSLRETYVLNNILFIVTILLLQNTVSLIWLVYKYNVGYIID